MGYMAVENKLWEIQMWLVQHERYTLDGAERFMYPLRWYIWTGRASAGFLKALVAAKAFVVGRVLIKYYGSEDEVVRGLRRKLNID